MLPDRLKALRKERSLTQSDLAGELGLTQQAVGRWETGRSFPDPDTLLRMAPVLGVDIDTGARVNHGRWPVEFAHDPEEKKEAKRAGQVLQVFVLQC